MSVIPTARILAAALLFHVSSSAVAAQDTSNLPPQIRVTYPHRNEGFSIGAMVIKIKAEAFDTDGSIAQVQFFADTNLIGIATNPPYNAIWGFQGHYATVRAVAIDNGGAFTESIPVPVYGHLGPPMPVVEITAPPHRYAVSAPATLAFAAEVLASSGDAGPVEFIVDGQSVGTDSGAGTLRATTPPSSVLVTNLAEGEHELTVRYHGVNGGYCACVFNTNLLRVVTLGIRTLSLNSGGRIQFEVVTSFPGTETIIQTSANLLDWTPVETNRPPTNTFVFTETWPATDAHSFYRVVLPSQHP